MVSQTSAFLEMLDSDPDSCEQHPSPHVGTGSPRQRRALLAIACSSSDGDAEVRDRPREAGGESRPPASPRAAILQRARAASGPQEVRDKPREAGGESRPPALPRAAILQRARAAKAAKTKGGGAAPAEKLSTCQDKPGGEWTLAHCSGAQALLGPANVSVAAAQKLTGAPRIFLEQCVPVAAQIYMQEEDAAFLDLLRSLEHDVDEGVLEGVMFVHTRAHDETPVKATKVFLDDAGVVTNTTTCKVLAMRRGFAMLLRSTDAEEYVHIYGRRQSRLSVMETQCAENLLEAIKRHGWLSDAEEAIVRRIFRKWRVVLSLTDSLPATIKAARAHARELGVGWKHAHQRCRIHRAHTCEQITVELDPVSVSGCIHLSLFLSQPGAMLRFRTAVAKHIRRTLVICYGDLPAEAARWRKCVEDVFMRGKSPRAVRRRSV